MIEDRDLKVLATLHMGAARPACQISGDVATIHSGYYVFEVPRKEVKVKKWPGQLNERLCAGWKTKQLPSATPGEPARALEVTVDSLNPVGEPLKLMKLVSEKGTTIHVQKAIYDFVKKQYLRPTFLVYPGSRADGAGPNSIAVYNNDQLVAAMAAFDPAKL